MNDEPKTWVITYHDEQQGRRVALTWGLTEDEAMHHVAVALELGFDQPRAERVDERSE